jgi:hypothetical protein
MKGLRLGSKLPRGAAMNTVVIKNYPASKLPEDMREGINPSSLVTVTIVQKMTSPPEDRANSNGVSESREPAISNKEDVDANCWRQRDERNE